MVYYTKLSCRCVKNRLVHELQCKKIFTTLPCAVSSLDLFFKRDLFMKVPFGRNITVVPQDNIWSEVYPYITHYYNIIVYYDIIVHLIHDQSIIHCLASHDNFPLNFFPVYTKCRIRTELGLLNFLLVRFLSKSLSKNSLSSLQTTCGLLIIFFGNMFNHLSSIIFCSSEDLTSLVNNFNYEIVVLSVVRLVRTWSIFLPGPLKKELLLFRSHILMFLGTRILVTWPGRVFASRPCWAL